MSQGVRTFRQWKIEWMVGESGPWFSSFVSEIEARTTFEAMNSSIEEPVHDVRLLSRVVAETDWDIA